MKPAILLLTGIVLGAAVCGCGKRISRNPETAFKELSHLAPLECECLFVDDDTSTNKWWLADDKVLFNSWGSVLLAFDLTKVTSRRQGNKLYLTLPTLEALQPAVTYSETLDKQQSKMTKPKKIEEMKAGIKRKAQQQLESLKDNPVYVKAAGDQTAALIRAFYASQFPDLEVIVELSRPLETDNRGAEQQ